jgi:hypothetical protein
VTTLRPLVSLAAMGALACAPALPAPAGPSAWGDVAQAEPPARGPAAPVRVLDVQRVEETSASGFLRIRVFNDGASPTLFGLDVRAEPGMWFAPVRQETHLYWLPPGGERTLSAAYRFARLSPESRLRVRGGVPEEHAEGHVHVPEPVVVVDYDAAGPDAEAELLERFDRVRGRSLEVYALKGAFGAGELAAIATDRDRAVIEVSRLLGVEPPPGLRLVFYPDASSKTADTRHVGNGLASGSTAVEVYNDSIRLDPYHELAHLVAIQLGWPPAWLSEGLAVHAAEWLGADALLHQGSPGKSVDLASCEFARAGELVPLGELFELGDIGPEGTRPNVSYAAAASFTAFLARRFGTDRLREAYRTLSAAETPEANRAHFRRIFGLTVEAAETEWLEDIRDDC